MELEWPNSFASKAISSRIRISMAKSSTTHDSCGRFSTYRRTSVKTLCIWSEFVAGDARFFLPETYEENKNYNYNDNSLLVDAIRDGARGAYWNILRQMSR